MSYFYKCLECGGIYEGVNKYGPKRKICHKCREDLINGRDRKRKIINSDIEENSSNKRLENKNFCPVKSCSFKSGNRPCIFFMEYKDGSASCPNIKIRNKILKQTYLQKLAGNGLE